MRIRDNSLCSVLDLKQKQCPKSHFSKSLNSFPAYTENKTSGDSLTWLIVKSVLETKRISNTSGASLNPRVSGLSGKGTGTVGT